MGSYANFKKQGDFMYINYHNYNGGINNLISVEDENGNIATSTISEKQAIRNLKRKFKKVGV